MTAYKKCPAVGTGTGETNSTLILRDERLLIQSLILRPAIFDTLGDLVLAIDFSDPGFSGLFAALKKQYATTGDIQIDDALKAFKESAGMTEGSHDDGCLAEMIAMLTADFCPWQHWPFYVKRVTDASYRRRLLAVCEADIADASNPLLAASDVVRNCESRRTKLKERRPIKTRRRPRPTPPTQTNRKPKDWSDIAKEIL